MADPLVVLRTNEEKGVKHKESCKALTNDDLERLEQIEESSLGLLFYRLLR